MKERKMLRILAVLLTLFIAAGLVAGCGAAKESTQTQAQTTKAAEQTQTEQEEAKISGEISYTSMWQEAEPQGIWWKNTAAEFEKQTGVKVNTTFAGRDILTKVKPNILSGNPPDIIDHALNSLVGSLLGDEVLLTPLDELLNEKGPENQDKMLDIFNANMLKPFEKDGKNYFIPYAVNTTGFFYDKNLFKQYNITPPQTWSDFMKVGETLKANKIAPLSLDGTVNVYGEYYFFQAVVRMLGPGSFLKAAQDTTGAVWDDPGYLKAAELVYDLSKSGKNYFQEGYDGSEYPMGQAEWAMGRTGMILCGSWIPVETQSQVKEGFEVGFFPFPVMEGGTGKITDVDISPLGAAIPNGSKNFEAAKAFLKFISNKQNAQTYADQTSSIPVRVDTDAPKILAEVKEVLDNGQNFMLHYDGTTMYTAEWTQNVLLPLDDKLIFGSLKPADFIKQVKEGSIKFWATKK